MPANSCYFIMLFKSSVSLFIFCLVIRYWKWNIDISSDYCWTVSFCKFCFIYFRTLLSDIDIYIYIQFNCYQSKILKPSLTLLFVPHSTVNPPAYLDSFNMNIYSELDYIWPSPLLPRILEWVATSSSRGSSQPRDWTCISCVDRQILSYCATWETHDIYIST